MSERPGVNACLARFFCCIPSFTHFILASTSPAALYVCNRLTKLGLPCCCFARNAQHYTRFTHVPSLEGRAGFWDTVKGWGLGMCQVGEQGSWQGWGLGSDLVGVVTTQADKGQHCGLRKF